MALLGHEGDPPLMNSAPSREWVAVRRIGPIACGCVSQLLRESRYSSRERDPSICNMWEREGSIESCTAIVSREPQSIRVPESSPYRIRVVRLHHDVGSMYREQTPQSGFHGRESKWIGPKRRTSLFTGRRVISTRRNPNES